MEPPFEQILLRHTQLHKEYLCAISKNCSVVLEKKIFKVCIKLTMFKMFLSIISPIKQVGPPFEQTLITHTQGLFVCNI